MEFRTKVEISPSRPSIRHSDKLMLWGSCFAESIGKLLLCNKFQCDINPFGVLYNPLSIAEAVRQIMNGKRYTTDDLLSAGNVWFSLMHHSTFDSADPERCAESINCRIKEGKDNLEQTDWLLFTWGTARVYTWKETGQIVGNCHKLPERMFARRLLETDEIVNEYARLLDELHGKRPDLQVMFTVSPIRHARDGMHGNQLSKATLLLAIDKLCQRFPYCHYFPSYEIMMDELRDYRFYADDMLHPSQLAVSYIWERFSEAFFADSVRLFIREWDSIKKGLAHRPFNPESENYRTFLSQILLKITELKKKFPYLDTQNEEQLCQAQLKK